jgi:hypothetical protein
LKPAILYHGKLNSAFAVRQDWSKYDLAIVADDEPVSLDEYRLKGMKVLSYTHPRDDDHIDRQIISFNNDGIFLDLAVQVDPQTLKEIYGLCMVEGKLLAVNSGWASNTREDYGHADIVMVESFFGTFIEGVDPPLYKQRDHKIDMAKVRRFKEFGYQVVALSYGDPENFAMCAACHDCAEAAGADYFIYTQSPAWERPGSGFLFWRELYG